MPIQTPADDKKMFLLLCHTHGSKYQIPTTYGAAKALEFVVYRGKLFKYKYAKDLDIVFEQFSGTAVYIHTEEEQFSGTAVYIHTEEEEQV